MCLSAAGLSITSMTTPTMLEDEYEGILLQCGDRDAGCDGFWTSHLPILSSYSLACSTIVQVAT